jgi:hypothetical protein
VLALLEVNPKMGAEEIADHLGVPVLNVDAICHDLAAAGSFDPPTDRR